MGGWPSPMDRCPGGATEPAGPTGGVWVRVGGTHLAEELVVVLRDEQEAAAERLGLLLQLGGAWGWSAPQPALSTPPSRI